MADQQQHRLDAFTLHQPQVAHRRHRRPVGPQERHGTQDGSQGFGPAEKETKSEKLSVAWQVQPWHGSAGNMQTHQKE